MNERDDDESLATEDGEHSNPVGFGARSEDGLSSSNTTSGGDSSSEEDEVIAESEDRAVIRIRLIVFGVLLLATAAVSTTVYLVTSHAEQREFEGQFYSSAEKVVDSFHRIAEEKVSAIGSLSIAYTSQVLSKRSNQTFPYVALDNFPEVGANVLRLSGALQVIFSPRVEATNESKATWVNYSLGNSDWMKDAYDYQQSLTRDIDQYELPAVPVMPLIWEYQRSFDSIEPAESDDYHLPMWEHVPVMPFPAVNVDLKLAENYEPTSTVIERGEVVLGSSYTYEPGDITSENLPAAFVSFLKSFKTGKRVRYNGEPLVFLFYPVFDSFDRATRAPVGVISAPLDWSLYFDRALPPETPPVVVRLTDCKT